MDKTIPMPHRELFEFGDYIIYVDESGDHSLSEINPEFPIFVLAFCIFKVSDYTSKIVPAIQNFKFKFYGHDMVILHEREIRKREGPFKILFDKDVRDAFYRNLNATIDGAEFKVVACIIDKYRFRNTGYKADNPYRVAMEFGLERAFYEIQGEGQSGKKTFVVFESRGKKEDDELELEFRRIMDRTKIAGMPKTFVFLTASKKTNSSGLQLADMVARPLGLHVLRPDQNNRALTISLKKLRKSREGEINGWGLKLLP
jgi:hypothetical protein